MLLRFIKQRYDISSSKVLLSIRIYNHLPNRCSSQKKQKRTPNVVYVETNPPSGIYNCNENRLSAREHEGIRRQFSLIWYTENFRWLRRSLGELASGCHRWDQVAWIKAFHAGSDTANQGQGLQRGPQSSGTVHRQTVSGCALSNRMLSRLIFHLYYWILLLG